MYLHKYKSMQALSPGNMNSLNSMLMRAVYIFIITRASVHLKVNIFFRAANIKFITTKQELNKKKMK